MAELQDAACMPCPLHPWHVGSQWGHAHFTHAHYTPMAGAPIRASRRCWHARGASTSHGSITTVASVSRYAYRETMEIWRDAHLSPDTTSGIALKILTLTLTLPYPCPSPSPNHCLTHRRRRLYALSMICYSTPSPAYPCWLQGLERTDSRVGLRMV